MKAKKTSKGNIYFAIIALFMTVAFTFSVSLAKYFHKQEYPIELSFIQTPVHFNFSPGETHAFTIPYDGYYAFQLWGGVGGNSKRHFAFAGVEEIYEIGGSGGVVKAVGYFQKGDILTITVGMRGSTSAGGFGGGGDGASDTGPAFNSYYGGGGGGATDVRVSTGIADDRILVAGGGGGASGGNIGSAGQNYPPSAGGNGGSVKSSFKGTNGDGIGFGYGGTQTGGEGWQNGTLGSGGNAQYSGGGGGGGYHGGGGAYGSGGGGGGGSSYIAGDLDTEIPSGLPGRPDESDQKNGYAIISFLGN